MVSKYEAYPFLDETQMLCDYELLTDRMSSEIGTLAALTSRSTSYDEENIQTDLANLQFLCELTYHLNASVRTGKGVYDEDVARTLDIGRHYDAYTARRFVLPYGLDEVGCRSHELRVRAKEIVRLLHKIEHTGVTIDQRIIDIFNIMSQIFFEYACKYGAGDTDFVSRVYKSDF